MSEGSIQNPARNKSKTVFLSENTEDAKQYFLFYEKYGDKISQSQKSLELLKRNLVFGPLIALPNTEDKETSYKYSSTLLKEAIFKNNWNAYNEHLRQLGILYAQKDLTLDSLYMSIQISRNITTPYIKQEYSDSVALAISVTNGFNMLTDYAMNVIAASYYAEKNKNVSDQSKEEDNKNSLPDKNDTRYLELEKIIGQRTLNLTKEVTKRKQFEEELIELKKQLKSQIEQQEKIKEELESFSYSVSHDLRAPLRAIEGFSKILTKKLQGNIQPDQQHYLDVIAENTEKMRMQIDGLLSFSRIGRKDIKLNEFDLGLLINQVFEELIRKLENTEKIKLNLEQLPFIRADREMMKMVILNLLDNAIKFNKNRPECIIEVGSHNHENGIAYFIRDNGAGFKMEYVDKIFGMFQKLHQENEFEGTGIGLALVQRIISRHQGKIWVESVLNEGTTFYFSVPK